VKRFVSVPGALVLVLAVVAVVVWRRRDPVRPLPQKAIRQKFAHWGN
jgi:hypothetical protein